MFDSVARSFLLRRGLHALVLLFLIGATPFAAQATVFTAGSYEVFGPQDPRRNLDWENPFNWEGGQVPTGAATIPAGMSVFLTKSVSISSLTVAGSIGGSTGAENLTVTGSCDWSDGVIGGNGFGQFNIATGAFLNLLGDAEKRLHSNLNNAGTINWSGTGTLRTGHTVTNTGTVNISAGFSYFGETGNGGIFNNSGTVVRSAGSGVFAIAGYDGDHHFMNFNNTGSIQVQTGTVQVGPGRSTGTFNVASGAVLRAANHDFDAAPLNGAGTYRFEPHAFAASCRARGNIVRTGGPLELLGVGFEGGFPDVPGSAATLSGTGRLLWKNGSMPGNWTFDTGFRIEASTDGGKGFDGSMVNKGTFTWMGGGALATGASTFVNEGTFTCTAPGLFLRDTYIYGAHFENRGTFNSAPNGENSTDDADFLNSGTVNIGGTGVGILRIYSGYTQTASGRLRVDIGGVDATVPQFDQLKMGQGATLAGALNVNFINGFSPQEGDSFRVVAKGGGTGVFSQVTTQNLTGKKVVASYTGDSVFLIVENIANISISDVTVAEVSNGPTTAIFTVTLSATRNVPVSINYAAVTGATNPATAGIDFGAATDSDGDTPGTLTIAAGATSGTIVVPIIDDALDEVDETFRVNLSNASNGTITDAQGIGTITDNDAVPTLAVANPRAFKEGSAAAPGSVTINVLLSAPSGKQVQVNFATANGVVNGAIAGQDYIARSGTLTFEPGQTRKGVVVTFIGDAVAELNEPFFLDIKTPVNATIADSRGAAYIGNDDGPIITIDNAVSVQEGSTTGQTTPQQFVVKLSAASTNTITVDWATANGTAGPADYAVANGRLTFAPGETQNTITIQVKGDTTVEPNETYRVNLTRPTFGIIGDSQGVGYIINDDSAPSNLIRNAPSE